MYTLQCKAFSFFRQSRFTQKWLLPTWILLGLSKIAIFTVSFNRLAPFLGAEVGTSASIPLVGHYQEVRSLQIRQVVRLAARYTPWNSNCFPQAVTARLILGYYNIPYALYFGLMRDHETDDFKAHAWISTGRVNVTGGNSFGHYTVVGCFLAPQLLDNSYDEANYSESKK